MARISKAHKQMLSDYAEEIGLRPDRAHDLLTTTVSQLGAAKAAYDLVAEYIDPYYYVKSIAPHNPTRHQERFKKLYDQSDDKELLLSEWKSLSPLWSDVKDLKSSVLGMCEEILINAGMSRDIRTKVMKDLSLNLRK